MFYSQKVIENFFFYFIFNHLIRFLAENGLDIFLDDSIYIQQETEQTVNVNNYYFLFFNKKSVSPLFFWKKKNAAKYLIICVWNKYFIY